MWGEIPFLKIVSNRDRPCPMYLARTVKTGNGPGSPDPNNESRITEHTMSESNSDASSSILRQACEQAKPEIDAVGDGDLIPVSTDVVGAATTGQGVYPEVIALRPV